MAYRVTFINIFASGFALLPVALFAKKKNRSKNKVIDASVWTTTGH